MFRFAVLLLACLTLGLQSCTYITSRDHVLISSEPLGASILIDGTDTGKTTPARVPIGGLLGTDHTIELRKPGFRPARRSVYQQSEGYTSKWIDGAYEFALPPLPLFWTFGDVLMPFGVRSAILPAELYVELQRTSEPLLGFELLAERARSADESARRP